jgi:hypothetical protein
VLVAGRARYSGDMALTPEERTAQRKIVGTLTRKSHMWFEPEGGFCIWRDQRASDEWGAGIPELSQLFDVLEIPYVVRAQRRKVGKQEQAEVSFVLVVAWDDLPALTRWVPSFQKDIDRARETIAAG